MTAAADGSWAEPYERSERPDSTAMAAVSHLGFLVLGVFLPLTLYLVTDKNDRFTRDHERESLNFQLTLLIPLIVSVLAFGVAIFASIPGTEETSGSDPPDNDGGAVFAAILIIWLVTVLIWLAGVVLSIIGAIKAAKGQRWRYPINIRFVKER